jgi:phosphatidylinositol-3-phosphatase
MPTRILAAAALVVAAPAVHAQSNRAFKHVFLIVMENHGKGEILGNTVDAPFINDLARRSTVLGNYYGVTHPSLPNYLALVSGSFQGIWDDCKAGASVTCAPEEFVPGSGDATDGSYLTSAQLASASAQPHWFAGSNIVDQLEAKGLAWKAYLQSMPAGGHDVEYAPVVNGTVVKLYAQKHNPFEYFSDIRSSPARLSRIVPLETDFAPDLASGNAPAFAFIVPDQCRDMHGISPSTAALVGLPECGYPNAGLDHGAIHLGDEFLREAVGAIVASSAWRDHSAIVIVWDEDDYTGFAGCCGSPAGNGFVLGGANAPALVLTSTQRRGQVSWKAANHYTMLGTLERLLGLDCIENTCKLSRDDLLLDLFSDD